MRKPDPLTLKQLRAFMAVCDLGSITAAAHSLTLSAPAVHTQLKSLEERMKVKLLNRNKNEAMTATDAGRVLYETGAKIFASIGNAVDEIEAIKSGLSGHVRLGVVSTAKYFAPRIVANLSRSLPDVSVSLVVGNRDAIVEALSNEQLDFAVVGRPPRRPNLRTQELGPHPYLLVARPGADISTKSEIEPSDILNETIVMREAGSGTRILAMRFLDRIGDGKMYRSIEMESNETIKQAIKAGLGIALISAHTVMDELEDKRLVALQVPSLPIMRSWYLVDIPVAQASSAVARARQNIISYANASLRSEDVMSRLI